MKHKVTNKENQNSQEVCVWWAHVYSTNIQFMYADRSEVFLITTVGGEPISKL